MLEMKAHRSPTHRSGSGNCLTISTGSSRCMTPFLMIKRTHSRRYSAGATSWQALQALTNGEIITRTRWPTQKGKLKPLLPKTDEQDGQAKTGESSGVGHQAYFSLSGPIKIPESQTYASRKRQKHCMLAGDSATSEKLRRSSSAAQRKEFEVYLNLFNAYTKL